MSSILADTFKMLGIQVDQMLTWDKQIDRVCLNITRKITLMKMLSKYVNQVSLKLYFELSGVFESNIWVTLTGCYYNNHVLRELENTQLSLRHPQ